MSQSAESVPLARNGWRQCQLYSVTFVQTIMNASEITADVRHTPRARTKTAVTTVCVRLDIKLKDHYASVSCQKLFSFVFSS